MCASTQFPVTKTTLSGLISFPVAMFAALAQRNQPSIARVASTLQAERVYPTWV